MTGPLLYRRRRPLIKSGHPITDIPLTTFEAYRDFEIAVEDVRAVVERETGLYRVLDTLTRLIRRIWP